MQPGAKVVQYLEHHLELSRECEERSQHGAHGHEHELEEQQTTQVIHTRHSSRLACLQPEQSCTPDMLSIACTDINMPCTSRTDLVNTPWKRCRTCNVDTHERVCEHQAQSWTALEAKPVLPDTAAEVGCHCC